MESIEGAPVPLAKLPVNTAGSPLGAHGVTAVLAVALVAELERPGHVREEEGSLLIGRAVHAVVHHKVGQVVNYRSCFEEPRPGIFDPPGLDLEVGYDVQGPSDERVCQVKVPRSFGSRSRDGLLGARRGSPDGVEVGGWKYGVVPI